MQKQIPMKRNPPISHLLFILLSFHPTGKKAPLRGAFFLLFFLRPLRRGAQTPPPHRVWGHPFWGNGFPPATTALRRPFQNRGRLVAAPAAHGKGQSVYPRLPGQDQLLPAGGILPPEAADGRARNEDRQSRRAALHQVPHPDPALHRPFQNRGRLDTAPAAHGKGQAVFPRLPY